MAIGLVILSSIVAFVAGGASLASGASFGTAVLTFYAAGFGSLLLLVLWITTLTWLRGQYAALHPTRAPARAQARYAGHGV